MYVFMILCTVIFIAFGAFLYLKIEKFFKDILMEKIKNQEENSLQKMDFLLNRFQQSKNENTVQVLSSINPLNKNLEYLRTKLEDNERLNMSRDLNLQNSIKILNKMQEDLKFETGELKKETSKMINALKRPNVRGKWGEVQLKKIAEISGMLQFCEFELQCDMGHIKPDMVVKLPNEGIICVDSKFPLDAYMAQITGEEFKKEDSKKEHSKAIKNHIYNLSVKKYWVGGKSPEIVIMFIPIEGIWLAGLDEDPALYEYAAERNVIVSTPMTLIGLLKTIYYGWSQVYIAKEAEKLKKILENTSISVNKILEMSVENQKILLKALQNSKNTKEEFENINSEIKSILKLENPNKIT